LGEKGKTGRKEKGEKAGAAVVRFHFLAIAMDQDKRAEGRGRRGGRRKEKKRKAFQVLYF